ncbi:response regulator transcription factor [Quisquiliibacterium transsilvanicum]|jgi:twitching motility two-component system response regulator PilH|uniref:Twitching motility two-component system response regulator PilH n=1 Tax=Quisquiliibacterium transsilvanicum TaxID=1549638 RepID=A0A7W8MAU0_9BURK|nr:response regulator [Quisquiliibacterium transsilvanicum]MBB5273464.1 twitching motility two-component system response regulator PilH [Quisquiliibacterium transsilvanicum]
MAHKILVVDDSPTERFFLADLLVKKGYTVITAGDGDEAFAKVKAERPSLVLMDVVMPGQSGYQVTRALSRDPDTQAIPVVMCTSKSNETDRIWGLRQGARDYLVKPIRPDELLAKIAGLVA